jgi:hypothetical protein
MTTRNIRRWALRARLPIAFRAAGAAFVFLCTAAPLPGDGPSCQGGTEYLDNSGSLNDDGVVRGCIDRCEEDCRDLQTCGLKPAGDAELRLCKTECSTQRQCASLTVSRLCPDSAEPVITENERDACTFGVRLPQPPACWCSNASDCWSGLGPFPGGSDPAECQRSELCDPRE